VVLFEMLFGYCPFQDVTIQRLVNKIEQSAIQLPLEKNSVSPKTCRLLQSMLVPDPAKRIKWSELISFCANFKDKETDLDGVLTQVKQPEGLKRTESNPSSSTFRVQTAKFKQQQFLSTKLLVEPDEKICDKKEAETETVHPDLQY